MQRQAPIDAATRSAGSARGESATPRVSVIIPTYNRADLVRQAVDSVLAQTYRDLEIVVVDDGSTDATREALEPVIPPVRYFFQTNGGLAAARNRGIREARGEFLAFLDSDDRFEPRMIEAVLETFEAHPEVGAVFTAEREIDMDNNRAERVYTKRSPGAYFDPLGMLTRDTRVGSGRPPVARREWIERLGGFDESIRCAVDCEMWIRYSFHMPMMIQPEPLILRRVHESNISGNQEQDARDWMRILDRLERERPEFVEQHNRVYRRARGKQLLRLGRELLARHGGDRSRLPEIRSTLKDAIAARPSLWRGYLYLAWSHLAPKSYGRFRRWEISR